MILCTALMATALLGIAANDTALSLEWVRRAFTDQGPEKQPGRVFMREDSPGDTKFGKCAAGGPLRLGDTTHEYESPPPTIIQVPVR